MTDKPISEAAQPPEGTPNEPRPRLREALEMALVEIEDNEQVSKWHRVHSEKWYAEDCAICVIRAALSASRDRQGER